MRVKYKIGVYVPPPIEAPSAIGPRTFQVRSTPRTTRSDRHSSHPGRRAVPGAPSAGRKPAKTGFHWRPTVLRGAMAAAALAVAAGCATLEPDVAKAWKIEPVLNVAHAVKPSQAYYTLGRYHDGSQAWDKAVDAYRKAIAADAENIEAYNALGVALARMGRLDQAETTLRQAVALDPTRAHVRSNLGYVLLLEGRPLDAVPELEAAVSQDVNNTTAMTNLREARDRVKLAQAGSAEKLAATTGGAGVADASAPNLAPSTAQAEAASPAADPVGERPAAEPKLAATDGLQVQVPQPITRASVPAPWSGVISVAAPLQTAAVPLPQTEVALARPAGEADVPSNVVRVIDHPTVASLQVSAAEGANRPLVRQSIVRTVELAKPALARAPLAEDQVVRLEVSNGNGVTGMAARVGKWLGEQGIKTASLTNQRPFVQQTTMVQFRAGQEDAAMRVARSLPAFAEPASAPTAGLRGDVRVVLGRDWVKVGACMDVKTCRPDTTAVAAAETLH